MLAPIQKWAFNTSLPLKETTKLARGGIVERITVFSPEEGEFSPLLPWVLWIVAPLP